MTTIISFNVNGIRAILKKGFLDFIKFENPDIFCLNETKINEEFLKEELTEYKFKYYNFAEKKGYSGVSIFSKISPLNVFYGLCDFEVIGSNSEGRVITLEFEKYFLISVYTPNSKNDLSRLEFRKDTWDTNFLKYLKHLNKKKEVIVCGDLNVAPTEIDLFHPKTNRRSAGFTDEERLGFQNYLQNGFIDSFRHLHPNKIQYTWWSYLGAARSRNVGWRIDHFLISEKLKNNLVDSLILDKVLGSDHCPIKLILKE